MSQDLLWLVEHLNHNILQIKQSVSRSSIKAHYRAQLEIKQNLEHTSTNLAGPDVSHLFVFTVIFIK